MKRSLLIQIYMTSVLHSKTLRMNFDYDLMTNTKAKLDQTQLLTDRAIDRVRPC